MEYRILDEEIKHKGRICDSVGVIFGLGLVRRSYVLDLLGFGRNSKMEVLNYYMKDCLRIFLTNYTYVLAAPLKLNLKRNIEFLIQIWVYRGLRFKQGLPVRGQSSRSNANSIKSTVAFFGIKQSK